MFSSNTSQVSNSTVYVEDVFSTYLYTGNGSTQTINNGIDLAGKGGMAWIKDRTTAFSHYLYDTARGATNSLSTDTTGGTTTAAQTLTSFNSTGFSLNSSAAVNLSNDNYASWTFRKQPKFFDVVTWSGNGVIGRAIPHSLGSVPGCIIVKETTGTSTWRVYHRSTGASNVLILNSTAAASAGNSWNYTDPTATEFYVSDSLAVNAVGSNYVAYLFAHNAGGFGLTGTDNVISCGTTSGGKVTLGWEPQWILHKASNFSSNWDVIDTMRGMPWGNQAQMLNPNLSSAEALSNDTVNGQPYSPKLYADGFELGTIVGNHIYIAIRRGPMKVPTDGTKVFSPNLQIAGGTATSPNYVTNFPVDTIIRDLKTGGNSAYPLVTDRLRGGSPYLTTSSAAAETADTTFAFDSMLGYYGSGVGANSNVIGWSFRRAPGFFDEVCYTGDGAAVRTNIVHNLGVQPEFAIIKRRNSTSDWPVSALTGGYSTVLNLNRNYAGAGSTGDPAAINGYIYTSNCTATNLWMESGSAGSVSAINASGGTYVAYLFASCPGVSKVGSYTGNGSTQTINCGFTGGARFVLIKRNDSTGDWYVWDTARGMVSGTDPSLLLNSTAAEVNANSIYTTTGGFQIVSTAAGINASGGSYIYLAIA